MLELTAENKQPPRKSNQQDKSTFILHSSFIERYRGRQPNWDTIGYVTYKRTYARELEDGTTEEFWQTLVRVVNGVFRVQQQHCLKNHLPWSNERAQKSAQDMFERMWAFKFLPPGRGLKMMGTDYVARKGGAALNNCAFVSSANIDEDFSAPFCFLMDMSMLGVGVGFDTDGAKKITVQRPTFLDIEHFVEDSREGWVEALRILLDAFVGKGGIPLWDFSLIRPAGQKIAGFGGTSAGPDPLINCLQEIYNLLMGRVGKPIATSDIVDIANLIGVCVVSGNVRRSAEIALGTYGDQEFLHLKDYNLFPKQVEHHRWASNNSVKMPVNAPLGAYQEVVDVMLRRGDPGVVWLENARRFGRLADGVDFTDTKVVGFNPCVEQVLENFELCCLVETFPANHESKEDFCRTLKSAYLYAKTVTLVPTHDVRTNAVMLRNRRIGTSTSGIVQAINKFGLNAFELMLDDGYNYIQELDAIYSNWLGVPKSIRTTSVKPSGTVSLLARATPGIHFPEAEYYWRLIRFASDSPLLEPLRQAGYRTEVIPNEPNTTAVFFPCKEHHFDRSKADVPAWEQFELAALMQRIWADNSVSITVTFKPEEAKDLPRLLHYNAPRLKAISLLPLGAHGHKYAPLRAMTKEEYAQASAGLLTVDFSTLNTSEVEERFCNNDTCLIGG